jgi:hypothetical protein
MKATVFAHMPDGHVERLRCYGSRGGLAIVEDSGRGGYSIQHVPSGTVLVRCPRLSLARAALDQLLEMEIVWSAYTVPPSRHRWAQRLPRWCRVVT